MTCKVVDKLPHSSLRSIYTSHITMQHLTYAAFGLVLCFVGHCVYNVFFHPLRNIPGPFLAKISRWWLFTLEMRGNPHPDILELHQKYGTHDSDDHIKKDGLLTLIRANATDLARRSLI